MRKEKKNLKLKRSKHIQHRPILPKLIIPSYAILPENWKQDTHLYLRNLEEVMIQTCADYGLEAGRKEGLTGV